MPLLEVEDLRVAYGELEVVKGISLAIEPGEIVTVLGSNGAGKTTTLRSLAGLLDKAGKGRITLAGRDITRLPPHRIADLGLALVPEGRQLFPEHTVRENLELGAYRHLRRGRRGEFADSLDEVFELFPRVRERLDQPAGLLSGGEQQMVAIARALVSRPRCCCSTSPRSASRRSCSRSIFDAFVKLKATRSDHPDRRADGLARPQVCDRAYVLENGTIALSGTAAEVAADPRVIEAYLGAAV